MALWWFLRAFNMTQMAEHSTHNDDDDDDDLRVSVGAKRGRYCLNNNGCCGFQMPLHYPRYKKEEYEKMEEWKLDMLLKQYGLASDGSVEEKRAFAIGTFLWPDQL